MGTEQQVGALDRAWGPARAAGAIGAAGIGDLLAHASGYVTDRWQRTELLIVDVGCGAGVPGLLLALVLPKSRLVLVDSSLRRCEMARAAAQAAGVLDRVEVRHCRVEAVAREAGARGGFDGAVVRSFGPPSEVAECALPLLRTGGSLVAAVSTGSLEAWCGADLSPLGSVVGSSWSTTAGSYLEVWRVGPSEERFPRRPAARRRRPLF